MLGRTRSLLLSTIVLGASLIPVHSFSISSACSSSLQSLITSEAAACLNGPALLTAILGSQGNDTISIPVIIDSWLSKVCTSGSCTDENIAAIATNITSGCSQDLAAIGLNVLGVEGQIADIAKQVYPTVRQIACLSDDSTGQRCAVQTLSNVDKAIGGLKLDDISLVTLSSDALKLISGAKDLVCTDCMKASFNLARQNFPSIVDQADNEAKDFCGAAFVDGNTPTGVSEAAQGGVFVAETKKNAASGLLYPARLVGNVGTMLVVVFSAMVFIA